ncbi:transcriptional regulator, GntR family [Moritella sp. PE36]|uniref:GntR family transcriptional regulator n=1 Tax=Moritella sp. PE36 TaxID=58051 RepID=UPI00015684A2|nr:GntR family transcriptional regulator [Moritella sp. PE36]EDM67666.1 transcriptional regulator, GntR family [Moritella sp. PE36]
MTKNLSSYFIIDRSRDTPIFEQLCEVVRKLAHSGTLKKGIVLPATRVLAEDLTVSRSTVVTAYEQLVAEGYLEGKVGAGYTICSIGAVELPHTSNDSIQATECVPTLMPLTPSQPDMRLFPYRHWAKSVARVCRTNPESMLTGADIFGNFALRKTIANHVNEWRASRLSTTVILRRGDRRTEYLFRMLTKVGQTVGMKILGINQYHVL